MTKAYKSLPPYKETSNNNSNDFGKVDSDSGEFISKIYKPQDKMIGSDEDDIFSDHIKSVKSKQKSNSISISISQELGYLLKFKNGQGLSLW